jgi:ribosomal protein S18 acetylase RimI-like enzyme
VTVRPLREDEYDAWYAKALAGYAASMREEGGLDAERARRKAEEDFPALLADGLATEGHAIFAIDDGGVPAGSLWVAERENPMAGPHLFVYTIEVDEAHRGRGLGRAAMEFAEAEARRRGFDRIQLNVFGGNEVARNLYRSLGYDEVAVYMEKRL